LFITAQDEADRGFVTRAFGAQARQAIIEYIDYCNMNSAILRWAT
jgi:hypothetical protein